MKTQEKKRFCLPKTKRIKSKTHFTYLFANAKKLYNRYLILYYTKAFNKENKVAFVASKKVGNAVIRNTCKRKLRELYRLNQHEISPEYDYVFVAKNNLLKENYWLINQHFITLIKQWGLYKI